MGTEVMNYEQAWEDQAKAAALAEPAAAGAFFSTRGGVLRLGEQEMPGSQIAVIVLDALYENSIYAEKYDPEDPQPPICYAFGRAGEDMGADIPSMSKHQDYFMPQNYDPATGTSPCGTCPMNEWGSADQGRGKACQNRRRLTLLPAGQYVPRPRSRDFDLELIDDPNHFQKAEVAFLRLPVTSVKGWSAYVNQISQTVRRPPHGVVTRIHLEPDPKSQYVARFEMLDLVPDAYARLMMDRHSRAVEMPLQGYEPPQPKDTQGAGRGALAGLRRPGA